MRFLADFGGFLAKSIDFLGKVWYNGSMEGDLWLE